MFILFGYLSLNSHLARERFKILLLILFNLILVYYCLAPLIQSKSASSQLTLRGAITPPDILMFLLVLTYFVLNVNSQDSVSRKSFQIKEILVLFSLGGVINFFLIHIQPFEAKWNYYPSKYSWVWLVTAIPLLSLTLSMNVHALTQRSYFSSLLKFLKFEMISKVKFSGIIVTILMLVFLFLFRPQVQSPWVQPWFNAAAKGQFGVYSQVLNGWANPSPEALNRIYALDVKGRQPVFFKYFIDPSDDRMSNFFLVLYSLNSDGTRKPIADKLSAYAYFADPVDVKSLCELIEGNQSKLVILTRSQSFEDDFDSICKVDKNELVYLIEK
jgi:hypothetical protein